MTNVHSVQYLHASQREAILGVLESRQGGSVTVNVYKPSWYNEHYAGPRRTFAVNAVASVFVGMCWVYGITCGDLKPALMGGITVLVGYFFTLLGYVMHITLMSVVVPIALGGHLLYFLFVNVLVPAFQVAVFVAVNFVLPTLHIALNDYVFPILQICAERLFPLCQSLFEWLPSLPAFSALYIWAVLFGILFISLTST